MASAMPGVRTSSANSGSVLTIHHTPPLLSNGWPTKRSFRSAAADITLWPSLAMDRYELLGCALQL